MLTLGKKGPSCTILNLLSEFVLKLFALVHFSFQIRFRNVNYVAVVEAPDDTWIQIVMVFTSEPHAALRVYIKGEKKHGTQEIPYVTEKQMNSGNVVIGRKYVDVDQTGYCSTMVDELMLWNRSLTSQEAEYLISLY